MDSTAAQKKLANRFRGLQANPGGIPAFGSPQDDCGPRESCGEWFFESKRYFAIFHYS
jgi:hypothetical protein